MLAHLKQLIPGAMHWPKFIKNDSEQFEARYCMVNVGRSRSLFLQNMSGAVLPIVVAHGEGKIAADRIDQVQGLIANNLVALQYIDSAGRPTQNYPLNPNGSIQGITGMTNFDGRVTIMMPHPERLFRSTQFSWHPGDWGEYSPWFAMFLNARSWLS